MRLRKLFILLCCLFALAAGVTAWRVFAQNALGIIQNPLGGAITAANASCATTPAACVWQKLPAGAGVSVITINGTYSATLQFEISADGGNTFINAAIASTSTTGVFAIPVGGYTDVRVRGSAYTSGQALVNIQTSSTNFFLQTPSCSTPDATISTQTVALSGTTITQFVSAVGNTRIYFCNLVLSNAGGTSPTFSLQYGTGTNCGTGTVTLIQNVTIPAANGAPQQWTGSFVLPAGNAACYTLTGTTPTGNLAYTLLQE